MSGSEGEGGIRGRIEEGGIEGEERKMKESGQGREGDDRRRKGEKGRKEFEGDMTVISFLLYWQIIGRGPGRGSSAVH